MPKAPAAAEANFFAILAKRFLSAVYRVQQASRFGTGLNHIVEVLVGADTDRVRRWNHTQLSTYGIGKDVSRSQWQAVGRELTRLGFVAVSEGEYAVLELTESGRSVLRDRRSILLTKLPDTPSARRVTREGEVACDELLFERLRTLRKKLADEKGVPAYIVFGDTTLRAMARVYPTSSDDMEFIPGVGEKKRVEYGPIFASEIATYLESNPRIAFA